MKKKEREMFEFEMDFKEYSVCVVIRRRQNFCKERGRTGLKTGEETDIFWAEIGSGFGEPGGTPPPRIPRSTLRHCYYLRFTNY